MGLFSGFFNIFSSNSSSSSRIGSETENAVSKLADWKRNRMSYSCDTYYPETGDEIDLDEIIVPEAGLKRWIGSMTYISDKAEQVYEMFVKEIENFRSYVKKLYCLDEEVKNDIFFTEVDHIFACKLKILYNELLFCKFAKLGKYDYYNKFMNIIDSVYNDLHSLNTYFADYMYALSRLGYEDNKQDLERIKICVKAMSETVDTVKSDI